MRQKQYILLIVIALLAVGIAFVIYRSQGTDSEDPVEDVVSTPSNTATPVVGIVSPISPISPVVPEAVSTGDVGVLELVEQANGLYNAGDYEKAIETFTQAIEINPIPVLYNDRGNAYLAIGDYERALADYETAIELSPSLGYAYYNRGRLKRLQGRYEDSIPDFQKSLELDSGLAYSAYNNIALSHYELGAYDEAMEAVNMAVAQNPTKATSYRIRGDINLMIENYEAAVQDYETAIGENPDYGEALLGLGQAYYLMHDYVQAKEALVKSTQIMPGDPSSRFYLGLVYLALDENDLAEETYRQGIDLIQDLEAEYSQSLLEVAVDNLNDLAQRFPDKTAKIQEIAELFN